MGCLEVQGVQHVAECTEIDHRMEMKVHITGLH